MTVSKTWTNLNYFYANLNCFSSFQPNYFYIFSAGDTIQIWNGSQDIQLLPNGAAFLNIKPILKYDSFKNMNKFQLMGRPPLLLIQPLVPHKRL